MRYIGQGQGSGEGQVGVGGLGREQVSDADRPEAWPGRLRAADVVCRKQEARALLACRPQPQESETKEITLHTVPRLSQAGPGSPALVSPQPLIDPGLVPSLSHLVGAS